MKPMKRTIKFLFAAPLLLVLVSCHSLTISMDENVPPNFSFSAGRFAECCRHLAFLGVYEVLPENQNLSWTAPKSKEDIVLWQIWPKDSSVNAADALPIITYGKVPPGFIQKIPESGEPPPLVEGRVYEVGGPAIEVPNAYMRFTIRNGKSIRLPIPGKDE
jgi:hypothetical protein